MTSFWELSNGQKPTGDASAAHTASFGIIPDGTQAPAIIKDFVLDESGKLPVFKITWRITDGDFKNRLVFQKIQAFDEKESKKDKAIEMMMRVYKLCDHKPTHANTPTNSDLSPMQGKTLGIKIQEWSMVRSDGTLSEGNWVSEVHKVDAEFQTVTGVKSVQTGRPSTVESAFSRNASLPVDDTDIPF